MRYADIETHIIKNALDLLLLGEDRLPSEVTVLCLRDADNLRESISAQ